MTEWTQKQQRARTWLEIAIVLGLSLGSSAVYSIVSLIRKLTTPEALNAQKAVINQPLSDQPIFDLVYQLLGIFFGLVPVVLVFWLLAKPGKSAFDQLGFNFAQPGKDLLRGFGLAAIIGIPGLGLYLVGNALGITVTIVPTALDTYWWTVPVLVLAALRAALVEELIVVGYLFTRLREFGWKTWQIILTSAALRGSYHLYQGFGPFVGNFVMGVVFGLAYQRWGRTMPLVIAHWILDIVSFTGYAVVKALAPGFLPGT
ncbi:CPBP family intramembrane glutamic endopeptidase [Aurantimicrobium minutum]|uniref:CPBP family intramembrane glutamic endopeptidase n=1 Tax=Aurantimicrobium minutum TaxID=708131 RepID=UPI0024748C7E|nr:type II CAAX endopeptidase family protein [Aurantimicrobium minutum]